MNLCSYQVLCSNLHHLVFPTPQPNLFDPHSPLIQVLLGNWFKIVPSEIWIKINLSERYGKHQQCRRHRSCRFDPSVRKIPWRRARQPTLAFLPGESQGQRSLAAYSPYSQSELAMPERLSMHPPMIDFCGRLHFIMCDCLPPHTALVRYY